MRIMFKTFYPDEYVASTYVLDFEKMYREGCRGLVFDIDNTLVPELHYHTPYLRTGACLSAAGVAAFAALIVITEIKRKKKKQHPAG